LSTPQANLKARITGGDGLEPEPDVDARQSSRMRTTRKRNDKLRTITTTLFGVCFRLKMEMRAFNIKDKRGALFRMK
jgi:hypothetical protein